MRDLEAQLRRYGAVLDGAEPALTDVADAPLRPARRSLLVAVAAVVVVAIAASAIAITATRSGDDHRPNVITPSSGPPNPTPTSTATARRGRVLAIGDSVMEGAEKSLQKEMPEIAVDAIRSRQFSQAQKVLGLYRSAGLLPGTVVIALGTNGRVTDTELDDLIRGAGDREVFFVTARVPRQWESEVNAALRALPKRWRNAHVIDWHDFANGHDDWFVADGFHLTTAGQSAYATLIASALGLLPKPTPPTPSGLDVVAFDAPSGLAPVPLALAGGDVWVASAAHTDTSSLVRLERRDPVTTHVMGTIDVPQEAVFSVAGDGDWIWVAGGGDGGVADTTVSKVNVRTGVVAFTKTLTGTPCSCPIVAGAAGVWLVGVNLTFAWHLSDTDGHVIGVVEVPYARKWWTAAMETPSRLLLGLSDGSVASVDPATNRVEGPLHGEEPASTASVTAMGAVPDSPAQSSPTLEGFLAHADGQTAALFANAGVANELQTKVRFVPTAIAAAGGRMWVFGGDRLLIQPTRGELPSELAYDPVREKFDSVTDSPATQLVGFRNAIVAGDRVWVVYDAADGRHAPSIVVVKIPVVPEG